jgi:hypothetical protein
MNLVKRYIPQKVYEKIQELDYKNKEHLYVISDMIYRATIFRKEDKDYSNTFIDIPKYYFRDLICDSKSLADAFSILKSNGVIESDNVYSKERGKALGYRFNNDMISKLVSVSLEKKTITKKIIKNRNERNNAVNETLHKYRNYFLNNFKIDYKSALENLDKWFNYSISYTPSYVGGNLNPEFIKIVNKYNHIFMSISAINDGDLYFRKNDTNGRIDTNLTSLKGEYRKFIISEKKLVQIDIINSQPFMLSLYLRKVFGECLENRALKVEIDKYTDWTSAGIFYEMFERTYFNKTGKVLTRKDIKTMMFSIFYSKNGSYTKEKNIFKSLYPNIMKFIDNQKKNKHNEFAIKLQRIESKICIDVICEELDILDIEYYTIHDAWLVDKDKVDEVIKVINRRFYENFYIRPELNIEKIN